MNLRVVDLFAGGGGLSLGFGQAGFDVIAALENWEPALAVYRANFPTHQLLDIDLNDVATASEVISGLNPDVVVGGPPCQDFSSAGKRDESQGRASLTVRFAETVARCMPQYFVMENVARAARSDAFTSALDLFKQAGYGVTIRVLDAAYCGVPQLRKRLFLVGSLSDRDGFLDDALDSHLSSQPMTLRQYFGPQFPLEHYYRHPRSYARRGVFSVDEPSPTIRGVNRPLPKGYPGHEGDSCHRLDGLRCLTTSERALIQTFPEGFLFPGTKTDVEQVVGNAVPVKLAQYVAQQLLGHIRLGDVEKLALGQLFEPKPASYWTGKSTGASSVAPTNI